MRDSAKSDDTPVRAWWFCGRDLRLQHEPHADVIVGETLEVTKPLALGKYGLHASRSVLDALEYAAGPIACRVELEGEWIEGADQICARRRRVLWYVDAEEPLRRIAADALVEQARAIVETFDVDLEGIVEGVRGLPGAPSQNDLADRLDDGRSRRTRATDRMANARWRVEERGGDAALLYNAMRHEALVAAEVALLEAALALRGGGFGCARKAFHSAGQVELALRWQSGPEDAERQRIVFRRALDARVEQALMASGGRITARAEGEVRRLELSAPPPSSSGVAGREHGEALLRRWRSEQQAHRMVDQGEIQRERRAPDVPQPSPASPRITRQAARHELEAMEDRLGRCERTLHVFAQNTWDLSPEIDNARRLITQAGEWLDTLPRQAGCRDWMSAIILGLREVMRAVDDTASALVATSAPTARHPLASRRPSAWNAARAARKALRGQIREARKTLRQAERAAQRVRVPMNTAPIVGRTYDGLPYGQGTGTVLRIKFDHDGNWARVLVRLLAGDQGMPPAGRSGGPTNEPRLSEEETWIAVDEWRQLGPRELVYPPIVAHRQDRSR